MERCGHCGTNINPGYDKCPACPAVRDAHFLAKLIVYPWLLSFLVVPLMAAFYWDQGRMTGTQAVTYSVVLLVAETAVVKMLGKVVPKSTTWVIRQPRGRY